MGWIRSILAGSVLAAALLPGAPLLGGDPAGAATMEEGRTKGDLAERVSGCDLVVVGAFRPGPLPGKVKEGQRKILRATGVDYGAGSIEIEEILLGFVGEGETFSLAADFWPIEVIEAKGKGIFFLSRGERPGEVSRMERPGFAPLERKVEVAGLVAKRRESERKGTGRVSVPAGEGRKFPGYIPRDAAAERPVPLVVGFHGHGDTASGFISSFMRFADLAGVALLAPEGVERVGPGFGWDGFPGRREATLSAIRAMLAAHPQVDPKRIVWLGFSSGTYACCEDAPLAGDLCRGILLTGPNTARLRSAGEGIAPPKVALFGGTEDPCCGGTELWSYRNDLKMSKAVASFNVVKGLPHAPPSAFHLVSAIHWVLDPAAKGEENRLGLLPPKVADRRSRRIRVFGSGDAVRAEAERLAEALRKAASAEERDAAAKAFLAGKKGDVAREIPIEEVYAADASGEDAAFARLRAAPLLYWAVWTAPAGEPRVIRSVSGFDVVWSEKEGR